MFSPPHNISHAIPLYNNLIFFTFINESAHLNEEMTCFSVDSLLRGDACHFPILCMVFFSPLVPTYINELFNAVARIMLSLEPHVLQNSEINSATASGFST